MKHFHVNWLNYDGDYRCLILYADSKAQACRLIREAYPRFTRKPRARELNG